WRPRRSTLPTTPPVGSRPTRGASARSSATSTRSAR
ncbi:MAG: DNA-directed RNA polymerase beta subunit, partial [uncultured Sphingomonas sp.]